MRRTAAVLLLGALLVGRGLLVAPPASACSCAGGTTAQYFDGADAVFTGRLVSREVVHPSGPVQGSADPALHVFAVEAVFKGDVQERQGVVSADSGASCGLELAGDGPFLVYGTRSPDVAEGQYTANLCGGTTTLTPALAADLKNLAAPGTPLEVTGDPATATDPLPVPAGELWPVLTLAGGLLLLLTAVLLLLRRRRTVR